MSRIAVTPYRGDDVEKFLPLLGHATRAIGGALVGGAKTAVSAGKGLTGAAKAAGKGIKEAGKAHVQNKLGIGSEEGGQSKTQTGMAALGSMQQASANAKAKKDEQTQGAMDAARRHAEISTNKGEPMDLAFRFLKTNFTLSSGQIKYLRKLGHHVLPDPETGNVEMTQEEYNDIIDNSGGQFTGEIGTKYFSPKHRALVEGGTYNTKHGEKEIESPDDTAPIPYENEEDYFKDDIENTPISSDTGNYSPDEIYRLFTTGEPMGLAFRLLKEEIDYENQTELAPHEQLWNDEADEDLQEKTNELFDYAIAQGADPGDLLDAWHDRASFVEGLDYDDKDSDSALGLGFRAHAVDPSQWKKLASEPMNMAFRLLKELYLEPMSEGADYDGLKRDLKNYSGSYNIKTDGDSMKLENVASDDKDMVKRIAEAYGHSATNEPNALENIKEVSYPQFHSGYLG